MNDLSREDIVALHDILISRYGGTHGVKNEDYLQSALSQPRTALFGADAYPTLVEKAAALSYSLNHNHAFHDGNKRIAYFAAEAFLMRNGYSLDATPEEQAEAMLRVADSQHEFVMSREDLVDWFYEHIATLM